MKHCPECDEDYETNDLYCHICGTKLTLIQSNADESENDNERTTQMNQFLQTMLDIFGIDFQNELRAHFNETNVQLSQEYITNLGKIEVDSKGSIFYNCLLSIGPLKINGVSSDFSELPFEELTNLQLFEANPICGEADLVNPFVENTILYFRRGVVPFATKAFRGQSFGAKAVIISQSNDRWPFIMTDSTQQSMITIPTIMISQSDGQLLEKYLSSSSFSSTTSSVTSSTSISLVCQSLSKECIICQEIYQPGDIILKLPCCHLYHQACLFRWLSTAHTCPLCRLELPTEPKQSNSSSSLLRDESNLSEEQRREQEARRHRGNYFV
jgi:hypothetical protein